jgi:hypothetical protein
MIVARWPLPAGHSVTLHQRFLAAFQLPLFPFIFYHNYTSRQSLQQYISAVLSIRNSLLYNRIYDSKIKSFWVVITSNNRMLTRYPLELCEASRLVRHAKAKQPPVGSFD